jgi:hypothetical protein
MGDVDLPVHAAAWWAWIGATDVGYLPRRTEQSPLLLWCIHLSWWLLGIMKRARAWSPLFGLASLWQVAGPQAVAGNATRRAVRRSYWPAAADLSPSA